MFVFKIPIAQCLSRFFFSCGRTGEWAVGMLAIPRPVWQDGRSAIPGEGGGYFREWHTRTGRSYEAGRGGGSFFRGGT